MELLLSLDRDRFIVVLLLQFRSLDRIVVVVGSGSVYCCVVDAGDLLDGIVVVVASGWM